MGCAGSNPKPKQTNNKNEQDKNKVTTNQQPPQPPKVSDNLPVVNSTQKENVSPKKNDSVFAKPVKKPVVEEEDVVR